MTFKTHAVMHVVVSVAIKMLNWQFLYVYTELCKNNEMKLFYIEK